MVELIRSPKRLMFVGGDLAAVLLANALAVALRFDFDWSAFSVRDYRTLELGLLDLLITPFVFFLSGLYQGYWKYASLTDLIRVTQAVAIRTGALIVLFYLLGYQGLSRAVLIIDTGLLLMFTGTLRLWPRVRFEFLGGRKRGGTRALIVGAGDTGEALLREMNKSPHLGGVPVGFVDDDREKSGLKIHGVQVLGTTADLDRLIREHGVGEVIVAIPGASTQTMQGMFEACRRSGARFKTVPTRGELQRGAARISQIRPVDLEDLLGRDVVRMDIPMLNESLSGAVVLVTGAAGSIGRQIARQVAGYHPAELIVLDRNENNLFYLEAELLQTYPGLNLRVAVADILDRVRVEEIFREGRPKVIFHAAAYKHVPLMEHNPGEAIKNNVVGTMRLAEIAAAHRAARFIYISTDKAVRPTSIMGASKRLGERLVRSLSSGPTRFMAVRFGNVLGSDGSVIPTFRRQIAAGGPVTVTHPEAMRFFMTIPEAVQLVMMAGAMGDGGEIFVLQMGQPVRILDLARNMIALSGLKADEDIKIVFTGLRPGEKLHEELQGEGERTLPTSNDKITVLSGVEALDESEWGQLRDLEAAVEGGRAAEAVALLLRLIPEYRPALEVHTSLAAATPSRIVEIGAHKRMDAQHHREA